MFLIQTQVANAIYVTEQTSTYTGFDGTNHYTAPATLYNITGSETPVWMFITTNDTFIDDRYPQSYDPIIPNLKNERSGWLAEMLPNTSTSLFNFLTELRYKAISDEVSSMLWNAIQWSASDDYAKALTDPHGTDPYLYVYYQWVDITFDSYGISHWTDRSLHSGSGRNSIDEFYAVNVSPKSKAAIFDATGGISVSLTNLDRTPAPPTVPLPAAVWLFGSALLGFTGFRKFRKA